MQKVKPLSLTTKRNSSIEFLKNIGIILIVISHVVQTLHSSNDYITMKDYILDISQSTTNIQHLILAFLRYSGALGNNIFFICSAWFLLDSSKVNKKKILHMLMDVWVISITILIIVCIIRGGDVSSDLILKQFFPTTFENNWYITCYLLFYPIHTLLNSLIEKMEQKQLLKVTLVMLSLYIGINFIFSGKFYSSYLILWISLYFAIAYMKYYLVDFSNNVRLNTIVLGIAFMGHIAMICVTNLLGLYFDVFDNSLLRWVSNDNPFLILIAISALNIARNVHFESKIVNYISSLSLLVYILHENQLLRTFYRPAMWNYVYHQFGYAYILIWTFVLVVLVFAFGLVASIIYKYTIQKIVTIVCDRLYPILQKIYGKIERKILKLH